MNKTLIYALCILLVEVAGFAAGMLTREGTKIYAETIQKPPLSPPGIVFPIAWTILYALMGIGLARVIMSEPGNIRTIGIALFAVQLILNLAWCFIFFGAQWFDLALVELIVMLVVVIVMVIFFNKCDVIAARTQIPYIIWLCFATYLNAGCWYCLRDTNDVRFKTMMKRAMHRLYENDDIVIFWNSEKCQHAAECVKDSPKTFNPMQRPWIDMRQAENAEIRRAVERYPAVLMRRGL